jgi:translocation and assembly module TamB
VASLALVCAIAATAFLAAFLDRSLSRSMLELKNNTVAILERLLGRTISYQSISPSILQFIEIRDLAIHDAAHPENVLLTIKKVKLSYSLWTLLFRRDPEAALREIHLENSTFDVDFTRDSEIVKLLDELIATSGGGKGLHVRISGANVNINMTIDGVSLSLSNLFFSVDSRSDSLAVSFRGGASGSLGTDFRFDSTLKVQGKVGKLLDWSDLTVNVLSLSSSLVSAQRQTYQVVWKERNIEVRKIWDHSPIDLQLVADLDKNLYTLNFQSQEFQPDSLFKFSGGMAKYNQWLRAPITASGYVAYQSESKSLDYRVDLTSYLVDQLPLPDVQLSGRFHGTEKRLYCEPLYLTSSSSGSAEFTGDILLDSFFPQGSLTMANLRLLGNAPITADVSLERFNGSLSLRAKRLAIGDIPLEPFELAVSPDRGGERFSLTTAFSGDPHAHQIRLEGLINIGKKPELSLSTSLTNVPANRLFVLLMGRGEPSREELSVAEALSGFALSSRLTLSTNFSDFTLSTQSALLTRWDDPKTRFQCALSLNNSRLSLSGFTGMWSGNTIRGDFAGVFSSDGVMSFSSGFAYRDTPYLISGSYSSRSGLSLKGSYGLAVSVIPITSQIFSVRASADHIPVPIGGAFRKVSLEVEGRLSQGTTWWVSCPNLTIYDLPLLQSRTNTLELSAVLLPGRLTITRTRFTDEVSILEGSGSATYQIDENPLDYRFLDNLEAQLALDLKGRGSAESYSVKAGAKDGALSVQASFSGVPLQRIGKIALAGQLAGNARVTGPIVNPTVEITVNLLGGRLGTDPLTLNAQLGITGDRLDLKNLSLGYLTHKLSDSTGSFRLGQGDFSITTHYRGEYFKDTVDTVARLEGVVKAFDWQTVTSHFLDSGIQGRLTLSNVTVNGYAFPSWIMDIHTDTGVMHIDGGPDNSVHGTFSSQNSFTLGLRSPNPLIGTAAGRIIGDRIESTIDVEGVDMRILNPILESPVVTFTSGTAMGRLTVSGPLNDPDFTGSLQLIGGGLTCIYVGDEAGPVSTTFTFKGKTFSFPIVFSSAGTARLSASGSFTIDHWVPTSFSVDLRTESDTVARMKAKFGSVRIDGFASGALSISGDEDHNDVKGSLVASDCHITLGPPLTGKFVPEDPPTFVSLQVETGKRIEFNWPSTELPVIRTSAKTGNTLAVTYRGDTGAYTVKGTVEVQGGEVYYFDRSFIMKSGKIALDESQAAFDPRITMRAEIREWDPKTNEEVKIYLNADNKLSMFSPSFTSEPSRSNVDILAMIGAPIVSRAETQGLGMSAVMLGSDIPIQFGLLRPFEQKVRELLGLDTFSLRTQIIQNLIAQKLFGMETNPLDNTSLSLGKYLGNDLFVEMLIRMQAQANNAGVPGTIAGIKADLEVNLEWATPFFILDWTFAPKTPQSLFIPDNSISLNWRISY